jgi:exonuclease VII small subunit
MHAAADHQHKMARALAQLDRLESLVPSLQLGALQLEAWIQFLERGRRHDA